jgi:hypothetical protein
MTYVVRVRPFEEFEICYELGLCPDAAKYQETRRGFTIHKFVGAG